MDLPGDPKDIDEMAKEPALIAALGSLKSI